MNKDLILTTDSKVHICDLCGDIIVKYEPHYRTDDEQFRLCLTCARHTK